MSTNGLLHLTTFLQGGAGRAICDLALGQRAAGRPVTVVTSRTGAPGYGNYPEYLARIRAAGIPLHEIDSTFQRDFTANLAVVRTLRERIDMATIDVVHAHAGTPAVIGMVLASRFHQRIPVVQTMHGWGTNKTPEQAARDLAVLRELDAVVATSCASATWLHAHGVPEPLVSTIPCGLDGELPAGDPPRRFPGVAAAKDAGAAVIACIGSVTELKNQALLVEALPLVRARLDRAVLCVFAGEGPLIATLEARARELGVAGQCWFLGYQPAAALLLELSDVLVLPSRGEGQGLAVLEAFRAGIPAVVGDIPALTELVQDGMTGYVFRGDSPEALADRVVHVLGAPSQERDVITAQAHARFTARFSRRAMLAAHEDLYARARAHARMPVELEERKAG